MDVACICVEGQLFAASHTGEAGGDVIQLDRLLSAFSDHDITGVRVQIETVIVDGLFCFEEDITCVCLYFDHIFDISGQRDIAGIALDCQAFPLRFLRGDITGICLHDSLFI